MTTVVHAPDQTRERWVTCADNSINLLMTELRHHANLYNLDTNDVLEAFDNLNGPWNPTGSVDVALGLALQIAAIRAREVIGGHTISKEEFLGLMEQLYEQAGTVGRGRGATT
jgi:hypothetical protein